MLTVVNTGVSVDVHTIRATLPPGQRNDPMASWNFAQLGDELVYAYSGWAGGGQKYLPFVVQHEGAPVPPDDGRLNGRLCTALRSLSRKFSADAGPRTRPRCPGPGGS